jgi:CheY-like chemotaxis protein
MGRSKKKILLIDASSAGLMVGKMILGKEAYDVVTARNGNDGLEKALAERPDLIVMSAGAASTAGPDASRACEALRAHEGTRATPILLVTTRATSRSVGPLGGELEGNVRTSLEQGESCDYVTKPISGLELLTKVRSRLGEPSHDDRQGVEA